MFLCVFLICKPRYRQNGPFYGPLGRRARLPPPSPHDWESLRNRLGGKKIRLKKVQTLTCVTSSAKYKDKHERSYFYLFDCFYLNAQRSWRRNATWSTLYNLCLSRLHSLHDNQTLAKRKESAVQQNPIYSLRTLSLPTILRRMQLHTPALSSRFIGSKYSSIRD